MTIKSNDTYWLWLNRLIKLWGYFALIIGSLMVLMNASWVYLFGNPISVNGIESTDAIDNALYVLFPVMFVILGWLIIKAKPINRQNNPGFFSSFEPPEKSKQPWE